MEYVAPKAHKPMPAGWRALSGDEIVIDGDMVLLGSDWERCDGLIGCYPKDHWTAPFMRKKEPVAEKEWLNSWE